MQLRAAKVEASDVNAERHVIVISIDGFPAYLLNDPNVPVPTIRRLAANGVAAEGMTVSNPSVTWPNHTTLVTGVHPAKHGVLFNGVLERPGLGLPVKVDPRRDKRDLVRAPTIYDAAKNAGLSTAAVGWPCTRNAKGLDDDFPDVPDSFEHTTPRFLESLKQAGVLSDELIAKSGGYSPAARDAIWTRAVCHVIRERRPNLVLFHLLNVDGVHHRHGPKTWAGYTALAYADTCVRQVLDAVDDAGIRERTTIFVVADHGFISIPKTLQPNVVLRKAGLLTLDGKRVAAARAHVIPEGGIGMLYLTRPDTRDADRKQVLDLFEKQEGIAEIILPDDFAKYGLPRPTDDRQMADLILVGKNGYGFAAEATGDEWVVPNTHTIGTHGFLSTNPRMNAVFVASGAGIRSGGKLGIVSNTAVAPTIAHIFGVQFTSADGKVLTDALQK